MFRGRPRNATFIRNSMAEPLKTFSGALVRRLAADVARVDPTFPSRPFVKRAQTGLDELELLDRAKHISRALGEHLPVDYPVAIAILLKSLGPELATDELLGVGMAPFYYLPHLLFVAERGLDDFDLSMRAQYELTKRCSAESSIRAFIAKDPERAFSFLRTWATDSNPHVRRLVSEGTRLRLPRAMRVAWLDANPERVLELLEPLKDDTTTLVRRSVANNLNDLGKVHVDLLVRTCERWMARESSQRLPLWTTNAPWATRSTHGSGRSRTNAPTTSTRAGWASTCARRSTGRPS